MLAPILVRLCTIFYVLFLVLCFVFVCFVVVCFVVLFLFVLLFCFCLFCCFVVVFWEGTPQTIIMMLNT